MHTAHSLTVSPYLVVSHACPPTEQPHTPPGATMHPPEQPHMPPQSNPTCPPRATMHAPLEQPHTSPPVNRMTNWCKNITLPQTSFAGGYNGITWKWVAISIWSDSIVFNENRITSVFAELLQLDSDPRCKRTLSGWNKPQTLCVCTSCV